MCVDYTDLNKHCPKDPFGLPRIDEVVDSTAGCELPTCAKDIQKLTCYMVAFSRFISRLGEKGLPFFKLLKASERFSWWEEANTTFE